MPPVAGGFTMESQQSLVLRRSARHDVALRARVTIAPDHAPFVRFSAGAAERQGGLLVDLVDLSTGGCGLLTGVFMPRHVLIDIQIYGLGGEGQEQVVEVRGRAQRVIMTDRRPAYLIGTAFEEMSDARAERLEWLVSQFGEAARKEARA